MVVQLTRAPAKRVSPTSSMLHYIPARLTIWGLVNCVPLFEAVNVEVPAPLLRSDVTDEEWREIEPLIPPAKRGANKPTVVIREVVNAPMFAQVSLCRPG
jgi:hypothetical protein